MTYKMGKNPMIFKKSHYNNKHTGESKSIFCVKNDRK